MDFAQALTTLMDERGISGCELARRVYCDRSLIYKFRKGRQQPSARLAQRCDEVLDAGGALMELARVSRRTVLAGGLASGLLSIGPGARERLEWAQRHPPKIDTAAVDSLADVLATQRHAEDALGSAVMLKPVTAQLEAVEDLVRQARGPVRPAVVNVAQQWAQFSGWLHRNTSDTGAARVRLGQALEWATELGDRTMIATVLMERAEMAAYAGQAGTAVGLGQAAQRDKRAAAGIRALAAAEEARGHALMGDCAAVDRKLGEAQELATALTDRQQNRPPWLYWMTPGYLQRQEGITCAFLAGEPRWHARAVTLLDTADTTGAWDSAGSLTWLAFAHTRADDVDQACATAVQAAGPVRQAGSVRLAGMLTQIRTDLAAQYPDDRRVKHLADALA
jgi:transcriptional regulator with XRE-family HTH domain